MKYLLLFLLLACHAQEKIGHTKISHSAIINGENVTSNDLSMSAVALSYKGSFCSGILISKNAVLTAAHCLDTENEQVAHIHGPEPLFSNDNIYNQIVVTKFIRHPEYEKSPNKDHDLAIAILESDVPDIFKIMPIYAGDVLKQEWPLYVAGFSGYSKAQQHNIFEALTSEINDKYEYTNWNPDYGPDFLFKAVVPYFDEELNDYIERKAITYVQMSGGTCKGDSGGPTLIKHEGKYYLTGINRAVNGPGNLNCEFFGLSTQVSSYRTWIEETLRDEKVHPARFVELTLNETSPEMSCTQNLRSQVNLYSVLAFSPEKLCSNVQEVVQLLDQSAKDCHKKCEGLEGFSGQCDFFSNGKDFALENLLNACKK